MRPECVCLPGDLRSHCQEVCRQVPRVKLVQRKRRVCNNVPRIAEKIVTEDECRDVKKEVCRDTTRTEQQRECKPQPVKLCRWVVKQVEVEAEEKVCRKIVQQRCADVEHKIVVNVPKEAKEKQCRIVNKPFCKNIQVVLLFVLFFLSN